MRVKANNLKDKIQEDNREIEKVYYDPNVMDPVEIEQKI